MMFVNEAAKVIEDKVASIKSDVSEKSGHSSVDLQGRGDRNGSFNDGRRVGRQGERCQDGGDRKGRGSCCQEGRGEEAEGAADCREEGEQQRRRCRGGCV